MNFILPQSTGSIAQDALRLGFQTTCNKGIAQLLKVDAITVEECASFKERHLQELKVYLESIEETFAAKLKYNFTFDMSFPKLEDYKESAEYIPILGWFSYKHQQKMHKNAPSRDYTVKITSVEDPKLNVHEGKWYSQVNLEVTAQPWCGYLYKKYKECPLEVTNTPFHHQTDARKCTVNYIQYDLYHEKYIPDEAAEAAYQAKQIGMTKLMVASPIVTNTADIQRDPIIVGHIGEQMFIIAWFGYDKTNHMSCNS